MARSCTARCIFDSAWLETNQSRHGQPWASPKVPSQPPRLDQKPLRTMRINFGKYKCKMDLIENCPGLRAPAPCGIPKIQNEIFPKFQKSKKSSSILKNCRWRRRVCIPKTPSFVLLSALRRTGFRCGLWSQGCTRKMVRRSFSDSFLQL